MSLVLFNPSDFKLRLYDSRDKKTIYYCRTQNYEISIEFNGGCHIFALHRRYQQASFGVTLEMCDLETAVRRLNMEIKILGLKEL